MTTMQTAPANNTPAVRRTTGPGAIIDLMQNRASALAAVATVHLKPEKLMKLIGVQLSRVPKLGDCTPMSVLECAMTCAELGLAPGVLGEAYLIPYGNTCTLVVGYRGLLKLARRSGLISSLQAEVVRDGDEFHWRLGVDATLDHIPKADECAPVTHAWAMAKFRDGAIQFAVMRKTEIDAIRKRSKASSNGPWVTDYAEMAKKTVLRRLCKLLPLNVDIAEDIQKVDATEFSMEELAALPPMQAGAAGIVAKLEAPADGGQGETPADAEPEAPTACAPGNPGCSEDPADYSTQDGKRVCANHAKTAAPADEPGQGTLLGTAAKTRKR